ncbi:hypothetical protein [Streptomyces sp. NPDC059788]|uniref:hypothetical protein n=1 Tax=Streptomyces sp. NPDC059788 TaxID=3346948 RepID=UPI00364C6EF5
MNHPLTVNRAVMGIVAAALSNDVPALHLQLRPLTTPQLHSATKELAFMAAEALITKAEHRGLTRQDVAALWHDCILDHELHATEDPHDPLSH